jgi:hypothetical protein
MTLAFLKSMDVIDDPDPEKKNYRVSTAYNISLEYYPGFLTC